MELTGPFASLVDVRLAGGRGTARFAPEFGEWREVFAGLRIPALLLDALLQFTILTRCGDGADELLLFTSHNDVELLERHGTGIVLATEANAGTTVALTPEGVVLMRMSGLAGGAPSGVRAPHADLVNA